MSEQPKRQCQTCAYWMDAPEARRRNMDDEWVPLDGFGECAVFPPSVPMTLAESTRRREQGHVEIFYKQPLTHAEQFCMQWRPRPAAE